MAGGGEGEGGTAVVGALRGAAQGLLVGAADAGRRERAPAHRLAAAAAAGAARAADPHGAAFLFRWRVAVVCCVFLCLARSCSPRRMSVYDIQEPEPTAWGGAVRKCREHTVNSTMRDHGSDATHDGALAMSGGRRATCGPECRALNVEHWSRIAVSFLGQNLT